MTVTSSMEVPAPPVQRLPVLVDLEETEVRVQSAESTAADSERALVSNRGIGLAIGILMCRRQLTAEQAIALLKTRSRIATSSCGSWQRAIYTGAL